MREQEEIIKGHYLLLFYALAFCVSAPFNSGYLTTAYQSFTKNFFISDSTYLPAGIGTLLAALVAFIFHKHLSKTVYFLGNNPIKNTAIAITPIIVFSFIGLERPYQLEQNFHYSFLAFALVIFLYALSEEIFWRGYLQNALEPIKAKWRYLFIGILWWFWHFRFNTIFDFTLFPIICIASSFLIGRLAQQTQSFLVAAGLHAFVILLSTPNENTNEKMIAAAITCLVWLLIGNFWKNKKASYENS